MAEYINRDDLLNVINTNVAEAHNERCCQLLEAILKAPTADVVEVKHGEWKIKVHILTQTKTVSCSECGYSMCRGPAWDSSWGLPPYCPECGTKMDGAPKERGGENG